MVQNPGFFSHSENSQQRNKHPISSTVDPCQVTVFSDQVARSCVSRVVKKLILHNDAPVDMANFPWIDPCLFVIWVGL